MGSWGVGRRGGGAAGLILVVAAVAGCGGGGSGAPRAAAANPLTGPRFGTMSGYVRVGPLRTIGASWVVPRVSAGKAGGLAATWIGAQAPGPAPRAPFIQVGINENQGPDGPPVYVAFWSAQVLSFHPHALFAVTPGDRITAALRLAGGRWRVFIADTTDGHHRNFATADNTTGRFNLAEWLQEDPATPTGHAAPYPGIGRVQFAGLTINGTAPTYAAISSQWMSAGNRDFGPTPLRSDAFSIGPVKPTAAGLRYLQIVARSDQAEAGFEASTARWRSGVSRAQVRSVADAQAAAQARFAAALADAHWPRHAVPAIHALVRQLGPVVRILRAAPTFGAPPSPEWTKRFAAANLATSVAAHRVRRALHLPEYLTAATARNG